MPVIKSISEAAPPPRLTQKKAKHSNTTPVHLNIFSGTDLLSTINGKLTLSLSILEKFSMLNIKAIALDKFSHKT